MPAGRPPLPTAVHELSGAYDHDPQRRDARANEPQPTGPLGDPPANFTAAQREVWHELVLIVPPGVLQNADRHLVEMYCRLMAKVRAATTPKDGDDERSVPDVKVGELNFLMSCLSRMGMTPADRTKISVPKPNEPANPFAAIAAENRKQ